MQVIGEYRSRHEVFKGLQRAKCQQCGLVSASPMPSETSLREYNQAYFANAHGGESTDKNALAFFQSIAAIRMRHVENYLQKNCKEPKSILEIGPGKGYLARSWLLKYPEIDYYALESDSSCHTSLKKFGVNVLGNDDMPEPASIDLIIMSHVLEHVGDPLNQLEECISWLKNGGVIFLEVPCRDWAHKQEDEPHVLFFEKEAMDYLLSRLNLQKIRLTYHGKKLRDLRRFPKIKNLISRVRFKLISFGIVKPFAISGPDRSLIKEPLQRAVIKPYKAHLESEEPAWWLRAMACKP